MKTQNAADLRAVLARDLMREDVITLAPDDTIDSALQTLEEAHIGGAPVVDSGGRLIGVLSLSDIARTEHVAGDRMQTQPGEFDLAEEVGEEEEEDPDPDAIFFAKQNYSPEVRGRERVCDWMAREVISVRPGASLVEVCEVLVSQGIHRVFVTEGRKLAGVVSSMDVARVVARGPGPRRKAKA
jgi:CBS domain-containing protein